VESKHSPERVSLVVTLFNEADSLEGWLDSLAGQTRPPDEVVLVDAGSNDGTVERLRDLAERDRRVKVHVVPGLNVPQGRNEAIRRAQSALIAVTDAGTLLDPHWLERLLVPIDGRPEIGVSGGSSAPDGRTPFEYALATIITPRAEEIDPERYLPSSRSIAFRRQLWERVGGYPDWLRAGEDLVFDLRLRAAGARFEVAPDAVVRWHPRPTLREFFKQYRHYARGDGHGHLWPKRHAARYAAYVTGLALVVLSVSHPWLWGVLAAGFAAYALKYARRVHRERPFATRSGMTGAYALIPVVIVVGDLGKMIGYPQGLWERWRAGGPSGLERAAIASHRAHLGRSGVAG
jgi:cellulose synthase/poly-beta-1,6-N-acetylglucosamine synthase-like glycosyltransferase